MNVPDVIDSSKWSSKGCSRFILAVPCGRITVVDQKEMVERSAQPRMVDLVFVE